MKVHSKTLKEGEFKTKHMPGPEHEELSAICTSKVCRMLWLTPHASQQLNEATEKESKAVHQLICTLFGPLGVEPLHQPPKLIDLTEQFSVPFLCLEASRRLLSEQVQHHYDVFHCFMLKPQ